VKRAILAAQNQGVHIVAAAGKPVLNRQSGYPARYQGVIAVGAVDSRLRPSRLSLRGDHLAFTAPGVGLTVAYGKDDVRQVDGTSFATPFVAAAFAMSRARGVPVSDLARTAQDLGAKGRDPVFGWGLVRYSGIPQC
jgi:subtilisin family serine protease